MGRPSLSDSTPYRLKGSPLCTILRYPFSVMDSKMFLKAFCRQNTLVLKGERGARAEKPQFFGQNFPKMPKNAFFCLFFLHVACGAEILTKTGAKQCFGKARKTNLIDLKKWSKFFKNFLKIRPLLEKILDPHLNKTARMSGQSLEFSDSPLKSNRIGFGKRKHWTPVSFGKSQKVKFWVVRNKYD